MLYGKKHIYVRSPHRISFVGGGTDIETYYNQGTDGHVVSASIDLYSYVTLKDMFDANVRVHHSEIETASITSRIQHSYSRLALEHFGMFKGAEVVLTSDVMTTGSGLGASSAMMSSLIVACNTLRNGKQIPKNELAELTYGLEHNAGTVGGKQDQYATVYGGINSITFNKNNVKVKPIKLSDSKTKEFQSRMFLVFTNLARDSKNIQINLKENTQNGKKKYFDDLQVLSHEFYGELTASKTNFNTLGKILNESWILKKSTNKQSSNPYIDQLYDYLKKRGIMGGKVLGAGGGGFFLAFAKDSGVKEKIKYDLYPNFIALDVNFSKKGTEVLWKNF